MTNNSGNWGPLQHRYAADRPRRMLALDGGGIRGIYAASILAASPAGFVHRSAVNSKALVAMSVMVATGIERLGMMS